MQISRKFCFLVLLVLLLQMHLVRFSKNASFKYCQVNWWKHELINKILEIKFYRNKITFRLALMANRSEATCNLSTDYSHQRTRVRIPTWDYDIDCSEVEILCRCSKSRVPGNMCCFWYNRPWWPSGLEHCRDMM